MGLLTPRSRYIMWHIIWNNQDYHKTIFVTIKTSFFREAGRRRTRRRKRLRKMRGKVAQVKIQNEKKIPTRFSFFSKTDIFLNSFDSFELCVNREPA